MKWKNIMSFEETVKMTASWYQHFFEKKDMRKVTNEQVETYFLKIKKK